MANVTFTIACRNLPAAPVLTVVSSDLTGIAGEDVYAVLSSTTGSIVSYAITSGTNGVMDGSRLSLEDYSAAGTWDFTVTGYDSYGQSNTANVSFTLTGAQLGALTGVGSPTMGANSATFTYTLPANASYAEVAINNANNTKYQLSNSTKKLTILEANTTYDFFLRAANSTSTGPWSNTSGTTLAYDPAPPDPGTSAARAASMTDGVTVNMYTNRTTNAPQTAYRTGDRSTNTAYNVGTWDTTGWLIGHWEPLAKVGARRIRSSFGMSQSASHQQVQIFNKLYYDCYGTRLDGTITAITAAQAVTAGDTTASAETCISRANAAYRPVIRSFQGLNEPNSTNDPWHTSSSLYPGGWRTIVIDHTVTCHQAISSYVGSKAWQTDVTYGSFSLWKRDVDDIRALRYVDYAGGNLSPYTTASNKQWIRDCLPLLDWINLHYYTGGRKPTIAGTPGKQFTEEGDPAAEITLDDQVLNYYELSNGSPFPIEMTENGWEIGNVGLRTAYSDNWLTENASIKYYQRQTFENLVRGMACTNWFEFIDNNLEVPTGNTGGKVYGMLSYSLSGGVYTFTRRKLWYMFYLTLRAMFDGNVSTGAMAATARTFTPGTLSFTLDNQSGGSVNSLLRHKLFQKSTGEFILALWYDKESWKRTGPFSSSNETFGSVPVRVTLGSSKTWRSTRPYTDALTSSMTNTWTSNGTGTAKNFTIHDDVTFVEIS